VLTEVPMIPIRKAVELVMSKGLNGYTYGSTDFRTPVTAPG